MSNIMKILFRESSYIPEPKRMWCGERKTFHTIVQEFGGDSGIAKELYPVFSLSNDPKTAQGELFGTRCMSKLEVIPQRNPGLLERWSKWFCSYNHLDNREPIGALYCPIDGHGVDYLWKIWLPCLVIKPKCIITSVNLRVGNSVLVGEYLRHITGIRVRSDQEETEVSAVLGTLAGHSRILKLARNTNLPIYDLTRLGEGWFSEYLIRV